MTDYIVNVISTYLEPSSIAVAMASSGLSASTRNHPMLVTVTIDRDHDEVRVESVEVES